MGGPALDGKTAHAESGIFLRIVSPYSAMPYAKNQPHKPLT